MKIHDTFYIHNYDFLFFDFDGVILDSLAIKTEAFRELYKPYGEDIMNEVAHHHKANGGMSRFRKFKLYHQDFLGVTLSDADVNKLAESFGNIVYEKVMHAPFIKGAREFLELCSKNNKRCFCVSGTPEDEIKKVIIGRGLDRYFKDIKGSPRDKTDNVRSLITLYGIDVKRALLFGDAINDLRAAQDNNITFIGINYYDGKSGYKDFEPLLKGNGGI